MVDYRGTWREACCRRCFILGVGGSMALELEELTIAALLRRSFQLYADLPALAFVGEGALTYAEAQRQIQALILRLADRHIRKGTPVAILGENSPQWVLAYLTLTSMGAVAVPILPGFPDEDVRHIIRTSECSAVFVSSRQRAKLEGAPIPGIHSLFSLEDFRLHEVGSPGVGLRERARQIFHKADGRSRGPEEAPHSKVGVTPDDLAAIIYTSGTTGHSKGVMLSHRNIVSDVVASIEKFPIDSRDRFLSILPLSHTYEATAGMLCPLAVGGSISYLKGVPAPRALLAAMKTVKPTGIITVPLVLDKIYRKRILGNLKTKRLEGIYRIPLFRKVINRLAGRRLIRSLGGGVRFFMVGGAAMSEELEVFFQEAGIRYSTGYGMTEAAPILTISPFGKVKVGSCGQPIPGVYLRILDPDLETGVGEILARGPNVMMGYYKNPAGTEQAFLEGRWLRTGDLGYLDEDGYLFIKGRSKNVIVGPSGENIYPEIIEQELTKSPCIQQAVVYLHQGKLIAKAYLDPDVLDQEFGAHRLSESQARQLRRRVLEEARARVNRRLPTFSVIQEIREQADPFELTPTDKLKRYLYVD
jgi:long-chain acyl-CoA synthetase